MHLTFKPYPHQQRVIDMPIHKTNNKVMAWATGTGKTMGAIGLLYKYHKECGVKYVTIICPLKVYPKWIKTIQDSFNSSTLVSPNNRETYIFLQHEDQAEGEKAELCIRIVTKEKYKSYIIHKAKERMTPNKVRQRLQQSQLLFPRNDMIIVDEAHTFYGNTSALHKALFYEVQTMNIKYNLHLTATPYNSVPLNVHAMEKLLRKPTNYHQYMQDYYYHVRMGQRMIPQVKANALQLLTPKLQQHCMFISMDEVVDDIPVQSDMFYDITRTSEQAEAIKALTDIEATTVFVRLHQIESGFIPEQKEVSITNLSDGVVYKNIGTAKLPKLHSILSNGQPTAVVARYTHNISFLREELEQKGYNVFEVSGRKSDLEELEAMGVLANGLPPKTVVLLQSSVSEGYELPTIEQVVFWSMDWSYKNYVQLRGRFLRVNNMSKTTFHHLITAVDKRYLKKGGKIKTLEEKALSTSIDQAVWKAVSEKKDFVDKNYELGKFI